MPKIDINSLMEVNENADGLLEVPSFDINSARSISPDEIPPNPVSPNIPIEKPKTDWLLMGKQAFQEFASQLQDLTSIPSRISSMPHLPAESKLVTETIPMLAEKAVTPIPGHYEIPTISMVDIRNLKKGRFTYTSNVIEPTPLDIGIALLIGVQASAGALKYAQSAAQYNKYVRDVINSTNIRSGIAENMGIFDEFVTGAESTFDITHKRIWGNLPVNDKVDIIISQAEKSPTLGDVIAQMARGTMKNISEGTIHIIETTGKVMKATPNVGETVVFTNPQGVVKTGTIKDIAGQRATINMGGKDIVAPLSQIVPPQPMAGGMLHHPSIVPIFYSKMTGILAEKMPESAPVDQIRGILKSAQISKEEIDWSGVEDFLKGKDKVFKLELLDYLQKNQMVIEETIKGGKTRKEVFLDRIAQDLYDDEYKNLTAEMQQEVNTEFNIAKQSGDLDIEEFAEEQEVAGAPKYSDTKYNVVTENYKEILLKIPLQKSKYVSPEELVKLNARAEEINRIYSHKKNLTQDQQDALLNELRDIRQKVGTSGLPKDIEVYQEPHFPEDPNTFAHARVADVTDEQGRKGLFANEIQSEWMREARREGFIGEITENKIKEVMQEYDMNRADAIEAIQKGQYGKIPYHPVLSRWHEVILKRLLRYAAENGYDFLAWATGKQVAEYYNLSKSVSEIAWKKNTDGTYNIIAYSKEEAVEPVVTQINKTAQEVEGLIGKEVAKKIVESKKKSGSLTGEDLRVTVEWAQNLYDRQIPNWLNDYGKKFGTQVEETEIPAMSSLVKIKGLNYVPVATEVARMDFDAGEDVYWKDDEGGFEKLNEETIKQVVGGDLYIRARKGEGKKPTTTQQSITITPEMKQALLGEGQPMFGKMAKDIGIPGKEFAGMKIFRMDEEAKIVNTKGEIVTLPKGEEYRTLPVYDESGALVPNKVRLVDGKQVTVYTGELNKLKGHLLKPGEEPMAGGKQHPSQPIGEGKEPPKQPPTEAFGEWTPETMDDIGWTYNEENNKWEYRDLKPLMQEVLAEAKSLDSKAKVYIIGSFAEGLARPSSDIDFYIQSNKIEEKDLSMEGYDAIVGTKHPEDSHKITAFLEVKGIKPPKKPPKTAEAAGPEEEPPKKRIEQRKQDMTEWNSPWITEQLFPSEKDFIKKYIDEGKSLKQIAKEIGEHIDDVKKTEMWTHAHMEEIRDEEREAAEVFEAGIESEDKKQLKGYLQGKLNPKLKEQGEYADLKLIPWLWAKEGEGVGPDELASELTGMGYPVENGDDVRGLIASHFEKEIQGRAMISVAKEAKTKAKAQKQGLESARAKKTPTAKPERAITGIGNGSVISSKDDIDYIERSRIFQNMPFSLLGNKAEVLSRLTSKLKNVLRQGIKKVYDLFGGAKGYRAGLFPSIQAKDYNLNELSNERSNYYKNIQDPVKQPIIKKTLEDIMTKFTAVMKDAFGLPEAKSDKDFLDMLNSWLKLGLRRERYYFAKEVIQDFGDQLLEEAKADNFASPESSAKYYFLENTSIFGIGPDGWTQGIIRTTKGDAYIKDVLDKLQGLAEKLDTEAKRDTGMPVTQEDAWVQMDRLVQDLNTGKINPKETVVLVDPQYLNPSEEAGTYSVGSPDTTWAGHKENLDKHLLPLIKTGVKIIYTNNADPELIKWMKAHKLPYNINKSIGAMAERRGRDEVISFIGFSLGPEWTMGPIQPTGAGATEPGQQYVAPRVTGESERFTEWLKNRELMQQQEAKKQELVAKIEDLRKSKMLSKITISRIKKYLGVRELKNTGIPEIQKVVDYIEGLKIGDKLLSENQIKSLERMFGEIKDISITPKRIAVERFGEDANLLQGIITSHVALELIPTVDIKRGNKAVTELVDQINNEMDRADSEIHRRDNQLEEMLRKAQDARAKKLPLKERLKRKLVKQDKEIFMALSGQQVELLPEEIAVVAYLKNFFAMVKEKLALEKFRKNYVTHLEQPFLEKVMNVGPIEAIIQYFKEQAGKKEIATDIMLELDNIIGSEKFFRFALERKGGMEPTTNIQKIVHDYSSLFETKLALDKILPSGQVITKLLLRGKDAVWMKKFLQNLKGRPLDSEFRNGRMGWLARIADGIVDIGYIKLLAFNWASAIKNLVAGEANAIIWQDLSTYLKGKQRLISNPKKAYKIAVELGVLEGTYADYSQRGIGKLKKLQDLAMIGQRAGEIEIRTTMFVSELTDEEWETEEISPARSRELRDNIAITQGVFSKTESPLWVQTILGRIIMQMNRWRITNAMLLRRIVNDAKEDWKQGNFRGKNTDRFTKAIIFYAIGMYVSYELGKAGFKKAAQIAQSMAEVVNSLISLISQGDLKKMLSDNPTLSVIKEFLFTAQEISKFIRVPGAQKPREIEFEQGIEDTYIAPLETMQDIIEELQ